MKVIKSKKILTMKGKEVLEGKYIIVENGIISDIVSKKPEGGEYVDASKMIVLPSFIDPSTSLGLAEEGAGFNYYDSDESTSPSLPQIRAIDAFYPKDPGIKDAIRGGISYFISSPGPSAVFSGLEGIFSVKGNSADEMVKKFPFALKLNMNHSARVHWHSQGKFPSTKMGIVALVREKFEKAKYYKKARQKETDLEMETIVKVLKGEIPLKVAVNTRDEIEKTLELKREYGVNIILQEAEDSYMVADLLRQEDIPVIVGPYFTAGRMYHQRHHYAKYIYSLYEKGILFALTTCHPVIPINYLYFESVLLVKIGIPELDAIRSITANPARILGMDSEVGTVEIGKKANLAFLSDDLYSLHSDVIAHMLEGEFVWKNF
ncbi:MAG: amidohydrolase family protein [Candidatus Hydrothermae bacterium]|nr:amidohydrolase family protein [Candidatus Hydrothermae bacterium]HPO79152.1 amidohydrolase family protein [Candidatus Hydrothermia bacterium]